jgi:dTDP-4-amino-4,6-dideoxygalactose transaminase
MIEYESLSKVNEQYFEEFEIFFSNFIKKGWYILGDEVSKFENDFANYIGTKYCIGVANGLDALIISLKVLELPKNAEIIVPSNTYIATILAIVQAGLKPILVEPNINTYNIDPTLISSKITNNTKAILVTHLYGKTCEMDAITEICKNHNLLLLEDCAQSHGAKYKGKMSGTFGTLASFSFYPTKNLGSLGDAGAILTSDKSLAEKIRAFRNYGSEKKYYNKYIGYNSRLDELQAGLLRIKLKNLDILTSHKRFLANLYFENITNSEIILPNKLDNHFDVYHIFNIRCSKRDQLKSYLLDNGIKTEIHYPLTPNRQEGYQEILKGDFPISDKIHNTTISLPISFFHTAEDVIYISKIINSFK